MDTEMITGNGRVYENIEHGFRGYRRYNCRCEVCVQANRQYYAEWRAKNRPRVPRGEDGKLINKPGPKAMPAKTMPPKTVPAKRAKVTQLSAVRNPITVQPNPPGESHDSPVIGLMEQAVIEETGQLSSAKDRPAMVQAARCMARVLDNDSAQKDWPTASRQLTSILESLRAGSSKRKSKGRLAAVQAMTRRDAAESR